MWSSILVSASLLGSAAAWSPRWGGYQWPPQPPQPAHNNWDLKKFTSLVTFGDSYTDESRLSFFIQSNNTIPPPVGWVQPVSNNTASGGYIWPRYVAWDSGANLYNYAVSGAVCDNNITPRAFEAGLFPSVAQYEVPAFLADKAYSVNGKPFLNIPQDQTVYAIWIGTNDLGNAAFLTDSQVAGRTIPDYVDCVYDQFQRLYASGGRYFVLMNVAPLELAPQYAPANRGGVNATKYFPDKPANITETSFRMWEQVAEANQVYKYRTPFELYVNRTMPGAHMAVFDMYSLITDMYNNPAQYLNGTAPPNVTSWDNQCGTTGAVCTREASPDSYLWFDELHPSEQSDRIFAEKFIEVVKGNSPWATYW